MNDYKYYLDYAIYDIQCNKYEEALEKLNKSLNLKSNWEIPYFYRGVVNQALDKLDDAILDYTKALKFNDKMTDAYYNRAKILLSRKDIQNPDINRAVSDLEKALELDENFIQALYAMGAAPKKIRKLRKSSLLLRKSYRIRTRFYSRKSIKETNSY